MAKTIILALGLALAIAAPAAAADQPTKWYLLNFGTAECETAVQFASRHHLPSLASPGGLETYERSVGLLKDKHIYRNDDGQIRAVAITEIGEGNNNTLWFTPSLETCEAARQAAIDQGILGEPGELK